MDTLVVCEDNLEKVVKNLNLKICIIARPDDFLKINNFQRLIVKTKYGYIERCFYGYVGQIGILIIYGRFDEVRSTSYEINFEKTQACINMLCIKKVIGTFVTGSIQDKYPVNSVFILSDFVGLGGYKSSLNKQIGFRNVDMFKPFCDTLSKALIEGAKKENFQVNNSGIYACFHGYPRIETEAELNFYKKMGWDVVGQTLDPEATLARESGCCYAAVAVTIDDADTRSRFLNGDLSARKMTRQYIIEGRKKTFSLVVKSLPLIDFSASCQCNYKYSNEDNLFYYLPKYFIE